MFEFFATLSSDFTFFSCTFLIKTRDPTTLPTIQLTLRGGNFCCSHLLPLLVFFSLSFSPHYHVFLLSPCPARGLFYSGVSLAYNFYPTPPPTITFIILFITEYCTDFYLFVLRSSLLISFLYYFVPALYSIIGSWCLPALHMVFLPWSRSGLRLSPSHCFVLDFQFINQILHSLSFSFLPLCSCECSVFHENTWLYFFYHRMSLSNAALTTTHPSLPIACINPIG